MEREMIVVALLKAAGGRLASRVRLQKTVYLLDRLGLESGFDYDYHHYGPFSRDIDNAVADAEAFEFVDEKFGRREVDGARYSIFELIDEGDELPEMIGRLNGVELERFLNIFKGANVTVLELAATANWLVVEEKQEDWQEALRRRKGRKVNGDRLEQALDLLRDIGLPPGTADANA